VFASIGLLESVAFCEGAIAAAIQAKLQIATNINFIKAMSCLRFQD
jgi:hypothetical protein